MALVESGRRLAQPASADAPALPVDETHDVLVVGGGTGGITVAARLRRARPALDVAVVEPSDKHFYQPAWTLVGAGTFRKADTVREEKDVIPRGATWLRDGAATFEPERNVVVLRSGRRIGYRYLVVAAGLQLDWGAIPGLRESVGKDGVCSNYSFETVDSTWEAIRHFRGGTAIFTQPAGAVKCGGAPQKIMYLADDAFRRAGVRNESRVIFSAPSPAIFAVPKYREILEKVVRRKGIETKFKTNLVEIRPETKEAVLENVETHEREVLKFDLLHVTPPMSVPDFLKRSPLADADGWVDVEKHSLRHRRFPNVFALGDCSSLPTSKTGAAIRKQASTLTANLLAAIDGRELSASYDGYTSCPVVTGYGKMVLAEFDYDKNPKETFPFNQAKERRSMWILKKYVLPVLYWHGMLKGRA